MEIVLNIKGDCAKYSRKDKRRFIRKTMRNLLR